MYLWTAFTIGLLGSLHCIGMCGPIALALPYQEKSWWKVVRNALLYNGGRVMTYGMLGLLPGLMGYGLSLAGVQQNLSIVLGVTLLVYSLFSFNLESRIANLPLMKQLHQWSQNTLSNLLRKKGSFTFLGIGMVNGLLPCGLVYMALAGALTQGTPIAGSAYMMLFGLGTIPLMAALGLSKQFLGIKIRRLFRQVLPVFMALIGVLLLVRGLNVPLPDNLETILEMGFMPMCH